MSKEVFTSYFFFTFWNVYAINCLLIYNLKPIMILYEASYRVSTKHHLDKKCDKKYKGIQSIVVVRKLH